jgi:hypothetical protein
MVLSVLVYLRPKSQQIFHWRGAQRQKIVLCASLVAEDFSSCAASEPVLEQRVQAHYLFYFVKIFK